MGKLTTYAKNKLLNHLFGLETYTPTDCYMGLFNGNPELGGVEANGNNYSRALTTFASRNVIGDIASNFCNSGQAYASSYYGDNTPSNAFNGSIGEHNNGTTWYKYNTLPYPAELIYDFGSGNYKNVTLYKLYNITNQSEMYWKFFPKNWTFEGSNNSTTGFDGDWVILDTQTNQYTGMNGSLSYNISNNLAYRWYKLKITANNSATYTSYIQIAEMEMGGERYGNSSEVHFPQATGSWGGTFDYGAIFDNSNNMLGVFQITSPFNVTSGEAPFINQDNINMNIGKVGNKGLTNYTKTKLLDLMFAKIPYTSPEIYLALSSTLPQEDSFTELTGSGYSRNLIISSKLNDASNGIITNSSDIILNSPTQSDWSELQAVVGLDSVNNILFYDYDNITNQTVTMENVLSFPAGNFSIGMN